MTPATGAGEMRSMRWSFIPALGLLLLSACAEQRETSTTGDSGSGASGQGGQAPDPNANVDGDCMTLAEETVLGTDDTLADTDGDGFDDCAETTCVSSPTDASQKCYACGWKHNDPGTLSSTGGSEGDVIANLDLIDQCKEPVKLWDFAGEYHILFMTAAW